MANSVCASLGRCAAAAVAASFLAADKVSRKTAAVWVSWEEDGSDKAEEVDRLQQSRITGFSQSKISVN